VPACRRRKGAAVGFVRVIKFRLIGDRLHAGLQRQHPIVACHHGHGLEFQARRQMHCADQDAPVALLVALRQFQPRQSGCLGPGWSRDEAGTVLR
jgi:hypothetical protein